MDKNWIEIKGDLYNIGNVDRIKKDSDNYHQHHGMALHVIELMVFDSEVIVGGTVVEWMEFDSREERDNEFDRIRKLLCGDSNE